MSCICAPRQHGMNPTLKRSFVLHRFERGNAFEIHNGIFLPETATYVVT